MSAKRALMVAYYFPPTGGAGVQRPLKLAKYLPRFGWEPVVLTPEHVNFHSRDPSLLAEIPEITVHRTPSLEGRSTPLPELSRWDLGGVLFSIPRWAEVPDVGIGWLPYAIRAGWEIIRREDIDLIWTTSPLSSVHLIGCALKWLTGRRWVMDFRDGWIQDPTHRIAHPRLEGFLERRCLELADGVSAVTEYIVGDFRERYPKLNPRKFRVIPNGFDPEDFEDVKPHDLSTCVGGRKFTIVYTGSFYVHQHNPLLFFQALRRFVEGARDGVRMIVVGYCDPSIKREVRDMGFGSVVEFRGYVPHSESIRYIKSADLLLLVVGVHPGEGKHRGDKTICTGKIFEYMYSGRPILALAPPGGIVARLVEESGTGFVVAHDDVEEIALKLRDAYSAWRAGELITTPRTDLISEYDRRNIAGRTARFFDEVIEEIR
ncbi:MAG: glycosyltransferase family 4 protein [bacterium]